jgi:anti-sigma-K factor RskA
MTDGEDPSMLSAGYALGILTPEERTIYEDYLATSAHARRDAAGLDPTAAALGLDAAPITPPASLKASIMAQVASTPQLSVSATEPSSAESVPAAELTSSQARPAEARASARWLRRPVKILVAAAAAILLFAGGTVLGNSLGSNNALERQQSAALAQIAAASDVQHLSAGITGGGMATLVWSSELGKSALYIDGLAQLPQDKTYQLWYIVDKRATAAGTIDAAEGTTWRVLDGELKSGAVIGVTVEPKSGSKRPTTTPIVTIKT